jgi:hypothetical protein
MALSLFKDFKYATWRPYQASPAQMQLMFSMRVQDSDGLMHAMDTRHKRQFSKKLYSIHLPTHAAFHCRLSLFPGRLGTHRRNLPDFVASTMRHVPLNGSTSGTMQLPAITLAANIRDISVNLQVWETLFEKCESISAARFCAIHRCGGRPLWNLAGANKHLHLVPHHGHHLPNLLHCAKELSDVL